MRLDPVERAELIDKLFLSFDRSTDHAVDEAWATEAESRIDAFDKGLLQADPVDAVFERLAKR